jgi:hypothetical protein
VHEAYALSVKSLTLGTNRKRGLNPATVNPVAHHRMSNLGEMDSELVGPPGFKTARHQAEFSAKSLLDLVEGYRWNSLGIPPRDTATPTSGIGHQGKLDST